MQTFEFPDVQFGHINHRTVYIHSNIECDGSVSIIARNECDDRVPIYMTRFWDRHSSLYKYWGSPSSSSVCGSDRLIHVQKRKEPDFCSEVNSRERFRRVEPFGDSLAYLGVCRLTDVYAGHQNEGIQSEHPTVSDDMPETVIDGGVHVTECSLPVPEVVMAKVEVANASSSNRSGQFVLG